MEDKEQKIKISFETNAEEAAEKTRKLEKATLAVEQSEIKLKKANEDLANSNGKTAEQIKQLEINQRKAVISNQEASNSLKKVSEEQGKTSSSSKDLAKNIAGLDTPIKSSVSGMRGMVKQMWLIVANPLGAILAAVALVLIGLVAVFKSFQPVVDKVEQAMAALGAVFEVVKNAFLAVFTGTKSLGEAFGGLGSDMDEAASRTMKLVKAQQDLDDVMKSQEVTTAKNRAEINKLNVELRNRTKTDEERLVIADKIVQKEKADFNQRKALVDEEVRIAREAIAIKAQFTKEEIKQLKRTGDATKELAESRGGNYDEEYDALNKARLKAIALEDEVTVNVEKAYNRRDKIQDDQQAKADKLNADTKARNEKAAAEQKVRNDKAIAEQKRLEDAKLALIKQGRDAEKSLLNSIQDLNDKTDEEKLARQKERALAEIEVLRLKGIDVTNLLIYNDEKYTTLEQELRLKRVEEKKAADLKTFEEETEAKNKQAEKDLEEEKKRNEAKIELAKNLEDSKVSITDKSLGLFNTLFGKNKKLQKAAMIAEGAVALGRTAVNTASGNASALALGIAQAGPVAGPAIAAPAITANTISGALSAATIIASTATALSSLGGGGGGLSSSGGGGAKGGGATSATPKVEFQASSENQIGNTLARNTNEQQPIQAYVVSKDITTAQNLDANKIKSNSI